MVIMKLKTLKKKEYWEALYIVRLHQLFGLPIYTYGWWKIRLRLIKEETI